MKVTIFCIIVLVSCGDAFNWKKPFNKKKLGSILDDLYDSLPPIPWVSDQYYENLPTTVAFYLYTRGNEQVFEVGVTQNEEIFSNFDSSKPVKILIHGWMGSKNATVNTLLTKEYLKVDDYNIIVFDWAKEAKRFYPPAKNAIVEMGQIVADFINKLVLKYKLNTEDLHLIGHSLGAHVSGIAGYLVNGKIGRITGLDPAFPLFGKTPNHEKLTTDSAKYVDIIHTCGMLLGMLHSIGHADFYPNQGIFVQPGCGADMLGKCSHRRAYSYFAESIKDMDKFIATKCESWDNFIKRRCGVENAIMGEYSSSSTRGSYYLLTSSKAPYGKGLDSITIPAEFDVPDLNNIDM